MKIKSRLLCSPGLTNSFKCKIGPVVSNILLSPLGPTFVSPDKLGFVSIETFRGGFHVINPIQSSLAALGCSRPIPDPAPAGGQRCNNCEKQQRIPDVR